jgi:putative oxidoreductase
MNLALWVVQGLLALAYLAAGVMKSTQPIAKLGEAVPPGLVRFIGVVEILGALGVVLPLATGVLPGLTVAAAIGLAAVQLCAAVFHASRSEFRAIPVNLVLLILALFVAYGRLVIVQT